MRSHQRKERGPARSQSRRRATLCDAASRGSQPRIHVIVGTRADGIKMAPVVLAFRKEGGTTIRLVATGQHRDLLPEALANFGLVPDVDLAVMSENQSLSEVTGRILDGLDRLFERERPDAVLVHGDTTTCFASALAAFYRGIPVVHVEAGLRSHRLDSPFPEELNRQLVSRFASLHLAPDEDARRNLIAEGVPREKIFVVGSTIADALRHVLPHPGFTEGDCVLVTIHRRENRDGRLGQVLEALRDGAVTHPEHLFVFPVHPHAGLRRAVEETLGDLPNVRLLEPLPYREFARFLDAARAIVTDSGGVQEEAALLGKPVLVVRTATERKRTAGARLVDVEKVAFRRALKRALGGKRRRRPLPRVRPSEQIVRVVRAYLKSIVGCPRKKNVEAA